MLILDGSDPELVRDRHSSTLSRGVRRRVVAAPFLGEAARSPRSLAHSSLFLMIIIRHWVESMLGMVALLSAPAPQAAATAVTW